MERPKELTKEEEALLILQGRHICTYCAGTKVYVYRTMAYNNRVEECAMCKGTGYIDRDHWCSWPDKETLAKYDALGLKPRCPR